MRHLQTSLQAFTTDNLSIIIIIIMNNDSWHLIIMDYEVF